MLGLLRKSILEGHLSHLQLPRPALNSFLSLPQEQRGQASSTLVGHPPRKTQALGLPVRNRWKARVPPPRMETRPFQKPVLRKLSSWGNAILPWPRRQRCICPSRCPSLLENLYPEEGGGDHPCVPACIPFSTELGFGEISLKFPGSSPEPHEG